MRPVVIALLASCGHGVDDIPETACNTRPGVGTNAIADIDFTSP